MMKGMFKRALGVVAAAAMAVTGMAALSGIANAAEVTGCEGGCKVTFTASDEAQLNGHTLHAYLLGTYQEYNYTDDSGEKTVYGITTVDNPSTVAGTIRDALNDIEGITDIDDDEDPLATVLGRDPAELANEYASNTSSTTRQLATALSEQLALLGRPQDLTLNGAALENGVYSVTVSLNTPGLYLIVDDVNSTNPTVPIIIGTCPVNKNVTINMKNQGVPEGDKSVTGVTHNEITTTPSEGQTITVNKGDVVSYKVSADYPDMTNRDEYTFTFTDTPGQGLTFDSSVADITINGKGLFRFSCVSGSWL